MKIRPRAGARPKIHEPSVVQEGAELGLDVVVGAFCYVARGARIGAGTRIQCHTAIWDGVELGQDVFVGPAATFTNVRRPRAGYRRDFERTIVGDGATLGAASVLVAPVRVGAHAMVGAGAVVVKDVPPNAIVAGNPARIIGWACACGERLVHGARAKHVICKHCGSPWNPGAVVASPSAMSYAVDFEKVSTVGFESSPVASALAGLRANEARYFKNKYDHVFTTEPASKAKKTLDWIHKILNEDRGIVIASRPLEATAFEVDGIKMAYVFYESGLSINVMYTIADAGKRAVGFKLSEGMEIPAELGKFKFARQKSKLAGTIRGSFFVIKNKY